MARPTAMRTRNITGKLMSAPSRCPGGPAQRIFRTVTAELTCPSCRAAIPAGSAFCPACGDPSPTAITRSPVIAVGEGSPRAGQKAEPAGIAARHEGHVSSAVTLRKIRCAGPPGQREGADISFPVMFLVRIAVGLAIGYAVLVAVGWLFQERLAFPAPRAPVLDPKRLGIANGERIEVVTQDGTR